MSSLYILFGIFKLGISPILLKAVFWHFETNDWRALVGVDVILECLADMLEYLDYSG